MLGADMNPEYDNIGQDSALSRVAGTRYLIRIVQVSQHELRPRKRRLRRIRCAGPFITCSIDQLAPSAGHGRQYHALTL